MKNNYLEIIEHYGVNNQRRKLMEEVYELEEALINANLKESIEYAIPLTEIIGAREHIAEEIADVLVLIRQFQYYYDLSTMEIEKQVDYKVDRQLKRMEADYDRR